VDDKGNDFFAEFARASDKGLPVVQNAH